MKAHHTWTLLALVGIFLVAPVASASEVVSCPPCRDRLEDRLDRRHHGGWRDEIEDRFDRREDRRDRREDVRDRREDRRDRRN